MNRRKLTDQGQRAEGTRPRLASAFLFFVSLGYGVAAAAPCSMTMPCLRRDPIAESGYLNGTNYGHHSGPNIRARALRNRLSMGECGDGAATSLEFGEAEFTYRQTLTPVTSTFTVTTYYEVYAAGILIVKLPTRDLESCNFANAWLKLEAKNDNNAEAHHETIESRTAKTVYEAHPGGGTHVASGAGVFNVSLQATTGTAIKVCVGDGTYWSCSVRREAKAYTEGKAWAGAFGTVTEPPACNFTNVECYSPDDPE